MVTGNCKDRVISEHFKQLHEETIKEFIPLIQKFDFDITVSTNQVIQICEKLSQGKAMAWDCVPDTSFKLCNDFKEQLFLIRQNKVKKLSNYLQKNSGKMKNQHITYCID